MSNLKVSLKLFVSFGLVILLMLAMGGVGIVGMYELNMSGSKIYDEGTIPLEHLGSARENFQLMRIELRDIIIHTGEPEKLTEVERDVRVASANFIHSMEEYRETFSDDAHIAKYNEAMSAFNTYEADMEEIIQEARGGMSGVELLALSDTKITPHSDKVSAILEDLTADKIAIAQVIDEDNDAMFALMLASVISAIVIVVVLSVGLSVYISGAISKPLIVLEEFMSGAATTGCIEMRPQDQEVVRKYGAHRDELGRALTATSQFVASLNGQMQILAAIAHGDLTVRPKVLSDKDNVGKALQRTVVDLSEIFSEINQSTHQVSDGARQVAEGAHSLAQGSTEQAATVQELSATINDIERKTRDNAEMSSKAATLGGDIMNSAEKGSRQMDDMVSAVNQINDASKQISKVIKVIDDIAFQTNILALNAAVEAARAGQHGKGFAVVAEEVRNLAAKSAEAANDTGGLIANSMSKAELGAQIAQDTAESLTEIVTGIKESTQLISVISNVTNEQSSAISQINISLEQVSNVIQQNSATAEQAAAASQQMSGQSDVLSALVERFKL